MKNPTKQDTKSDTIKKANTKKAAMKNVGQEIAEFGVKNMQAGSKARGVKTDEPAKLKSNTLSKGPGRKSGPSKAGFGTGNDRGGKKKAF